MMSKVGNHIHYPPTQILNKINTRVNVLTKRKRRKQNFNNTCNNNNNNNNNTNNSNNCKLISPSYLTMLDCKWKFSLYITLTDCELIENLHIPFEILHIIMLNCEGTMRNCDICDNEVLDLRFTKGYRNDKRNKKLIKKETKRFRFVLCNICQEKVMASYEKVDRNLESMGMRGI